MALLDPANEELILGIAYALFMNRLHVLRLTEVVRLGIKPSPDDGNMEVPDELDRELIQQSVDYVLKCLPQSFAKTIDKHKGAWLELA
jgi:hypothetical protein